MKRDYFEFNNQRVRDVILVVSNLRQVDEKEAARNYIRSIVYQEVDKKYKAAREIAIKKTAENKKRAEAAATKLEKEKMKSYPKGPFGRPWRDPFGTWYQYEIVRGPTPAIWITHLPILKKYRDDHIVLRVSHVENIHSFGSKLNFGQVVETRDKNGLIHVKWALGNDVPNVKLMELTKQNGRENVFSISIDIVNKYKHPHLSVHYYLGQELQKLREAVELNSSSFSYSSSDTEWCQITGVAKGISLSELAANIPSGKVLKIDQQKRTIYVSLELPSNLPSLEELKKIKAAIKEAQNKEFAKAAAERERKREKEKKQRDDFWNRPRTTDKEPRDEESVYTWAIRILKGEDRWATDAVYKRLMKEPVDNKTKDEITQLLVHNYTRGKLNYYRKDIIPLFEKWNSDILLDRLSEALQKEERDTDFFVDTNLAVVLAKLKTEKSARVIALQLQAIYAGGNRNQASEKVVASLSEMGDMVEPVAIELLGKEAAAAKIAAARILYEIGTQKCYDQLTAVRNTTKNDYVKEACKLARTEIRKRKIKADKERKNKLKEKLTIQP